SWALENWRARLHPDVTASTPTRASRGLAPSQAISFLGLGAGICLSKKIDAACVGTTDKTMPSPGEGAQSLRKKRVLSIGFGVAGGDIEHVSYSSDRSLLDADIVLFTPALGEAQSLEQYNGKPLLTEADSTAVPKRLTHWHSELCSAFAAGKRVVVFLPKPVEVFVYTVEKQFSGTGRGQKVTTIVGEVRSYASVPYLSSVTPKTGVEIVANGKVAFFAPFW